MKSTCFICSLPSHVFDKKNTDVSKQNDYHSILSHDTILATIFYILTLLLLGFS